MLYSVITHVCIPVIKLKSVGQHALRLVLDAISRYLQALAHHNAASQTPNLHFCRAFRVLSHAVKIASRGVQSHYVQKTLTSFSYYASFIVKS